MLNAQQNDGFKKTPNNLLRAVMLLLQTHFITSQFNIRYRNTHFSFNVNFIALFRIDHSYR